QHAVEIAEHPDVTDASAAIKLYRRIAFGRCREGLSEECETKRALDTEKIVLGELLRRPDRQHANAHQASCLSVVAGSVRSATSAGVTHAASAVMARTPDAAAYVIGSSGVTP